MEMFKKMSVIILVAILFCFPALTFAATKINLGSADSFAVLAGSGITNTGATTITGDIGTFPTISETGFASITLDGTNNIGNAVTQGAKDDLVTAFNNSAGQLPVSTVATELGGTIKNAGIYDSEAGTFGITGTLTLDAQGDSSAVFIFKTTSTLITASSSKVVLINGANSCNVFWQVGSSMTLGTTSDFKGTVMAVQSITDNGGSKIEGRLLARNAAVTLNNTTINNSACNSSSGGTKADTKSDIKVKKTASDYTLTSGPDKVTFTYKVTNEGDVALTDISVKDDKCDDVEYVKGDKNDDDKLDKDEEWKYECKKTVKKTETNKVTAKGTANGERIKDTDTAKVTVSVPGLPAAGVNSDENFWDTVFEKIISFFSV